jgi:hypothetical protein
MIHRKFNNLKFRRTYIGGSKQEETRRFTEVQGTKEDNSECNWFEYRRMLKEYCDDKLNIILSWKLVSKNISLILAGIAALVAGINIFATAIIFAIGLGFYGVYRYLKSLEQKRLFEYNFSLDIINEQTGLVLPKN